MSFFVLTGDPDEFQVDRCLLRALSREQAIQWRVGRCREQIQKEDTVFLLRTAGGRYEEALPGVIALATVVRVPEHEPCAQPDLWRTPPRGPDWYALIELEEVRLSPEAGMVRREGFRKSPPLAKLGAFTELRLSYEQADAMRVLWRRAAVAANM